MNQTASRVYTPPSQPVPRQFLATITNAPTPKKLWYFFVAIGITALVFWNISISAIATARQGVQTLGKDTTPSIIAAEGVRATLADTNSDAADAFLQTEPKEIKEAWDTYQKDILAANDHLLNAAQNITFGDVERKPVLMIMDRLQAYSTLIGQARNKTGTDAIKTLRQANDVMRNDILPAAAVLDKVNFDFNQEQYNKRHGTAQMLAAVLPVLVFGGMFIGLLIWLQLYLRLRFRRLFNVPMVAATVLAMGVVGNVALTLVLHQSDLKLIKEDCFDSVHALWKARAIAFDFNTDESLYLLAGNHTDFYSEFTEKTRMLVDRPITPEMLEAAREGRAITFQGFLADELRNVTFPGEREAASETLFYFDKYLKIDAQIRVLERAGKHNEAIQLALGYKEGESNWAYSKFDDALGRTLDINQKEFDAAVANGFSRVSWMPYSTSVAVLLIVALLWLGLRPRLAEYRIS
jgi:hypothetical protein